MTGQDERGDEQVKIIADAWMLHQGFTQEEIEASVNDLDHSLCEMIPGVGWDCIDEDGTHRHPEYVALFEASEMANVALDALAQAGFHLTPDAEVSSALVARGLPGDAGLDALIHQVGTDARMAGVMEGMSARTAEVKAEDLAQIIEPLLAAHGTKARNAYYVRCRCGYSKGSAEGPRPTLHAHEAQVIAKAIATHLREKGETE